MSFPSPVPGLVIRYSSLWSREATTEASEGRKDRTCAIVVAVPRDAFGNTHVVVVPVTHSPPMDPTTAVALLPGVQMALGLDAEPAWVCLDEINTFSWPGYDLRVLPGTDRIDYGALAKARFEKVRQGVVGLQRARRVRQVGRD